MPRRFLATRLSPSSAERARNALDLELDRPSEFSSLVLVLLMPLSWRSSFVATRAKNIQPRGIFFSKGVGPLAMITFQTYDYRSRIN